MDSFGLADIASEPDRLGQRAIVVIGLILSAFTATILVTVLRLPTNVPLYLTALIYILLIAGANTLGIRLAGNLLRRSIDSLSRRSAATAVWIAPLAVYLRASSVLAIPLAVITSVRLIWLFKSLEESKVEDFTWPHHRGLFQFPDPPPMTRLLSLVCAGACIEATVAAGASQTVSMAVLFASTGTGIIGWQVSEPRKSNVTSRLPRELISSGLTLMLAFILTMNGMGSGFGDGDGDSKGLASGSGGAYWGVFLRPEDTPRQIQLVPVPSNPALFDKGLKLRVRIAFDGVYWFFKLPATEPPLGSITTYGTPDEIGFRSTDSTPLMMEAHQTLVNHLDLSCCEAIEVSLRSTEKLPGTVIMQVILQDSSLPLQKPVSLGTAEVTTAHPLRFVIPEHLETPTFDQITMRFFLDASRNTVSPRIAVVDFIMIPR